MNARTIRTRTMRIQERNPKVLRVPAAPWITFPISPPTRINRPAIGRDDLL